MDDRNYVSWRSKKPQTAVGDTATQRWEMMLTESKNALDDMAKMIHQAGYHLDTGEKLVGLLEHHEERVAHQAAELGGMEERIFGRLDEIERRMKSVEKTIYIVETEIDGYKENLDMTVVGQPEVMTNPVASFDRMVAYAGRGIQNEEEKLSELESSDGVGEVKRDSFSGLFEEDESELGDSVAFNNAFEVVNHETLTPTQEPISQTMPTLESLSTPISLPPITPTLTSPSSSSESILPPADAGDVKEEPMISFKKLLNEHRDHAA